jgi:hypothetical protein
VRQRHELRAFLMDKIQKLRKKDIKEYKKLKLELDNVAGIPDGGIIKYNGEYYDYKLDRPGRTKSESGSLKSESAVVGSLKQP